MVNVFSFHISWNPFISGDSIKEMASGFAFWFGGFLFCFCSCLGCGVGFLFGLVLFFNLILWLCVYSGRNLSWREEKKLLLSEKMNPESFLNVSCYEKDKLLGHTYADFFSPLKYKKETPENEYNCVYLERSS